MLIHFRRFGQGGSKYFTNPNPEDAELQEALNSMKLSRQKDSMKQIIASMTIGKDVSKLFPDVVKLIRTKNIELKKLVYLYLINYARVKPDLIFLAVAAFHSDAKEGATPLIRGLAIRTMGCIRVPEIVSYLCETLSYCIKDKDAYVRKTAAMCVSKLYQTSPQQVRENGFINTLHECLDDENPIVVANAMSALSEISILSGVNQIKIKSKNLKNIIDALSKANEWAQVQILDALVFYNTKKSSHAEEVIEGVMPRLSHVNQSVVMSTIKVIMKFMDCIDDIEKIKTYCKKLTNSIMSVLISYPEIQYILLRSLHAIVLKRPILLEKEFKYFYVQYNDPIYIKLEKVDILYKLCNKKNYEMIIQEFTSYALTETNPELIQKSIRYIGYVGYKFESSYDLCVNSISKIIDNNNEDAVPECIIVSRDLMRKYKSTALNLIKKINLDLINSLSDLNAKSAALYIIGEFCEQISESTEIITYFVNNFSNIEMNLNSKVKCQILNACVKNFLTKPDECEEIVKVCLQKGAEESENPDVRDRAYIYWRLLEIDPDIAKEMICSEKPAFKFTEHDELDVDTIDDMINNMTNVSACYFKKDRDIINEEDMVVDEEARKEKEEKEKKEKKEEKKEKKEKKKKKKKKKKKDIEEEQINEADLIGLGGGEEFANEEIKPKDEDDKNKKSGQNQNLINNDIFDIFSNNNNNNTNLNKSVHMPSPNNSLFNFGDQTTNAQSSIPKSIFENSNQFPTTKLTPCYNQNNIVIYSQFQRANGLLQLGLYFSEGGKNGAMCNLSLNKNSFGLICAPFSEIRDNIALFPMKNNMNNADRQPPGNPFVINASLQIDNTTLNIKLIMNICVLYIENGKLSGKPFVDFYTTNQAQSFNSKIYTYPNYDNEEDVKIALEKNNIFFSAKQGKDNTAKSYFSANILGSMPFLVEIFVDNGEINLRIIANNPSVVALIKESIDSALN